VRALRAGTRPSVAREPNVHFSAAPVGGETGVGMECPTEFYGLSPSMEQPAVVKRMAEQKAEGDGSVRGSCALDPRMTLPTSDAGRSLDDKLVRLSSRGLRAAIMQLIADLPGLHGVVEVAIDQQLDIRQHRKEQHQREPRGASLIPSFNPSATNVQSAALTPLYAILFDNEEETEAAIHAAGAPVTVPLLSERVRDMAPGEVVDSGIGTNLKEVPPRAAADEGSAVVRSSSAAVIAVLPSSLSVAAASFSPAGMSFHASVAADAVESSPRQATVRASGAAQPGTNLQVSGNGAPPSLKSPHGAVAPSSAAAASAARAARKMAAATASVVVGGVVGGGGGGGSGECCTTCSALGSSIAVNQTATTPGRNHPIANSLGLPRQHSSGGSPSRQHSPSRDRGGGYSNMTSGGGYGGAGGASGYGTGGDVAVRTVSAPPRPLMLPTTGPLERRWQSGFIFFCRHDSFRETFERRIFGLTRHKMDLLNSIEPGGTALFLFDQTFRYLHGVYDAASAPGFDLDACYLRRGAAATFKGVARSPLDSSPFPAQVRFTRLHDFPPIEERKFCHLVNYNDGTNVFRHRLGQPETKQLLELLIHPEKAPNDNQLPFESNGYVRIPEKDGFHELRRQAYGH